MSTPSDELSGWMTPTDPKRLRPQHGVTSPARYQRLLAAFQTHGWNGPPLLAFGPLLLNGSHRMAAALAAGLSWVPVVDLSRAEVCTALLGTAAWNDVKGYDPTDKAQADQAVLRLGVWDFGRLAELGVN